MIEQLSRDIELLIDKMEPDEFDLDIRLEPGRVHVIGDEAAGIGPKKTENCQPGTTMCTGAGACSCA